MTPAEPANGSTMTAAMLEASCRAIRSSRLSARPAAVNAFLNLIEKMARETADLDLHEKVDHVIQASGLIEFFRKEKGERGETRIENLEDRLERVEKHLELDPAQPSIPTVPPAVAKSQPDTVWCRRRCSCRWEQRPA